MTHHNLNAWNMLGLNGEQISKRQQQIYAQSLNGGGHKKVRSGNCLDLAMLVL